MTRLGVNIDHVATLRQARGGDEPDPVAVALLCEKSGADGIVCHLREDRRHINEEDVRRLRRAVRTPLNLEMSLDPEIIRLTAKFRPDVATLVPERRKEITTEGGLNVVKYFRKVQHCVETLAGAGIPVSLFIDPAPDQINRTIATGAKIIELHTGTYAEATTKRAKDRELKLLVRMTAYARSQGLSVSAGHGLKYHDTRPVARIPGIDELNIGHSIISRAVTVGITQAVKEMKKIIKG